MTNYGTGANTPAAAAYSITPDDAVDLAVATRGLLLGAGGNVKVDMLSSGTITLIGLASGIVHPLRVKRVYANGTTATGIIGLY